MELLAGMFLVGGFFVFGKMLKHVGESIEHQQEYKKIRRRENRRRREIELHREVRRVVSKHI
jgi:hypothetical protein